jgi:hypothetical protein
MTMPGNNSGGQAVLPNPPILRVPEVGTEPTRAQGAPDFESDLKIQAH